MTLIVNGDVVCSKNCWMGSHQHLAFSQARICIRDGNLKKLLSHKIQSGIHPNRNVEGFHCYFFSIVNHTKYVLILMASPWIQRLKEILKIWSLFHFHKMQSFPFKHHFSYWQRAANMLMMLQMPLRELMSKSVQQEDHT